MSHHSVAIHWYRRDLRISDNTALAAAAKHADSVIPVYVVSQWEGDHLWTGAKRQSFLCGCLSSLAKNIETIGGRLIIRSGDAVEELIALIKETGATALHTNRDPDPFGTKTEAALESACQDLGVSFHAHEDIAMHDRDGILNGDDTPYRVYTPYSKRWLAADKPKRVSKPKKLKTPSAVKSENLPSLETWNLNGSDFEILGAGERAARKRLEKALSDTIATYDDTRDIPSVLGTSRLSQDLRFGTISIRTVYTAALKRQAQCSPAASEQIQKYIKELAWRDFYMQILWHYPEVLEEEFNPSWRGLPWDEPGEQFDAWKEGRTGFPIIDAGIREMLHTGFMHNRVRMIVAMFLTKDLHIDWRLGESFFMQHLVDGEIASNNGGWQWSAGTGADAAPYFRIQNPWTQSKRYDPKGEYIKRWVPELKDIPAKQLFEPPSGKKSLAADYPPPIVDHSTERDRTLAIFKAHKEKSPR